MRVGVLPVLDRRGGGVYQYSLMVLDALHQLRSRLDPIVIFERSSYREAAAMRRSGWHVVSLERPTRRGAARRIVATALGESFASGVAALVGAQRTSHAAAIENGEGIRGARQAWLRENGIELMVYPSPTSISFESGIPYVMAVHDLQHRIHPEFPEVSANGELERREHLYANGIRGAEAIIVDSDVGRDDVLHLYGHLTSAKRVHVLPFVLPPYLAAPRKETPSKGLGSQGIPARYLLFPAQFWPHKNHVRVTEAVASLHRAGVDVAVVMTGSAGDPIRDRVVADVREIMQRTGIDGLIHVAGYVDDDLLADLYRGAVGVILPTFFGPTNIPIIEAWAIGVPVLSSDIRGIREQCEDAAILVDPFSVNAIADGLRRLWSDDELRAQLVAAGRARVASSDSSAFRDKLHDVLVEAASHAAPGTGSAS